MKKIVKYLIILFTFVFCIDNVSAEEVIDVSSKNVILYNLNEDKVLYEKDADNSVNIASLTKIMTAIVAIENIDNYDEKVLVTYDMLKDVTYDLSVAGFKKGETLTYNDLLYGTLLKSGADATNILAISISGSIDNFVKLMNDKAKKLGMNNTNFSNTIGIEGLNHYSSARDIATLLKYCLNNEKFIEVFKSKNYVSTNGEHDMNGPLSKITDKEEFNLTYIKGAKTGYTSKAGLCLASIATYNDVDYLLVTIGADYENKTEHIDDTKEIYEYFFNNYEYKEILSKGDNIVKLKTIYGKEYDVVSDEDYEFYLKKSIDKSDLVYEYKGETLLGKNVSKNDKIGSYYVKYKDEVLYVKSITSPVTVKFDILFFLKQNILLVTVFVILIILSIMTIRIKKR